MFKKNDLPQTDDKVINIEAGMQGNLKFTGPVNLRLNGDFEGDLEAKGILTIGEKADVKAKTIKGDSITIAGLECVIFPKSPKNSWKRVPFMV